jgi:hypothetical protein
MLWLQNLAAIVPQFQHVIQLEMEMLGCIPFNLLYHAVVAFDVLTWLINVGGLFRYTPSMPCRKLFKDVEEYQCFESNHICYDEHGDACSCSNFLDMDWLSTSGNSCEEDLCDR